MIEYGLPIPALEDTGFSVYSESDEDGILHLIFSVLGTANKTFVDIGAAIGASNTANLAVHHAWTGLLIEGSSGQANATRTFYETCALTRNYPPRVICEWVTRANVNDILVANGIQGEIDLLCIDIDGVDYYIWEAIECISPRVVVLEYQCIWGPEESKSVPYSDEFVAGYCGRYAVYSGASLAAFVKLGRKKNYRLVGCQRYGYNAFFIRNDIGLEYFPEVAAAACFKHPFTMWAQKEFLPRIADKDWVDI